MGKGKTDGMKWVNDSANEAIKTPVRLGHTVVVYDENTTGGSVIGLTDEYVIFEDQETGKKCVAEYSGVALCGVRPQPGRTDPFAQLAFETWLLSQRIEMALAQNQDVLKDSYIADAKRALDQLSDVYCSLGNISDNHPEIVCSGMFRPLDEWGMFEQLHQSGREDEAEEPDEKEEQIQKMAGEIKGFQEQLDELFSSPLNPANSELHNEPQAELASV